MKEQTFRFSEYSTLVRYVGPEKLAAAVAEAPSLRVFDENTRGLLPSAPEPSVILPAGETAKHWDSVRAILEAGLEASLARDGRFIGVGGGVVCDMTAFAASVYMRGARLVLAPTTLLAMVDASLGGKTGFDFGGCKNFIGTFYPAETLLICLDLLKSLPERELLVGLAEAIKTGMLGDPTLLELIEKGKERILRRDEDTLGEIVRRCVEFKGRLVEEDLRETGRRAFLNLGHTFAHALEAAAGFGVYSHGEAVAWGLDRALDAGVRLGLTDPAYRERIRRILSLYGFRLEIKDVSPDSIIKAVGSDKKKRGGSVKFVLQSGPGVTLRRELDESLLRDLLA